MSESEEDIVITSDDRLRGCHGRVLIAVLVLAALLLLLLAILFQGMLSGPAPQPVRRASADGAPIAAAELQVEQQLQTAATPHPT